MIKIIIFLLGFIFVIQGLAKANPEARNQQSNGKNEKYCALMSDGVLMLMTEGKVVSSNVTLKNGTVVTTDGTVIRKDGTKIVLSEGSCIDKNGNIKKPEEKPLKKKGKK